MGSTPIIRTKDDIIHDMTQSKLYSKDILANAVAKSDSLAEAARFLGKRASGSRMNYLTRLVKEYGLDTSHFIFTKANRETSGNKRKPPSEILKVYTDPTANRVGSVYLTRALMELGVPYECKECGVSKWNGKHLVLDVDHIDGNSFDCRAENLRFLCPNCHRQTPTFGRQKNKTSNTCACGASIQKRSKQCAVCYANRSSK